MKNWVNICGRYYTKVENRCGRGLGVYTPPEIFSFSVTLKRNSYRSDLGELWVFKNCYHLCLKINLVMVLYI